MQPYAEIIGDPVDHSLSPALHSFWLSALGIDADYRRYRVQKGDLNEYLAWRRSDPDWRGCNVTAPLKEEALEAVGKLTPTAQAVGAVNLIFRDGDRLIGDNCDVAGIAEALPSSLIENCNAVVIGSGGAARAALAHLIESRVADIRLFARRGTTAAGLQSFARGATRIRTGGLDDLDLAGADLLVNASPMGMQHAPMPLAVLKALRKMKRGARLFDMVYEPLETALMASAGQWSIKTIDGLVMLMGQADRSFRALFDGVPPRHLDGELRAHLVKA